MLRLTLTTLAGLVLSLGISLTAVPSALAMASLPASLASSPDLDSAPAPQIAAFLKRFDSAFQTDDQKGMERAVGKYPGEAVEYFEQLANNYNISGDSRLAPRMDKLKELFKKVHGSTILEKIEGYTSEWGEEERKLHRACEGKYRQHFGALKAWQAGKKEEDKQNAYKMLQESMDGYKELGDLYRYSIALLSKFALLRDTQKESVELMEKQDAIITEFLKIRGEDLDFKRDKDYAAWDNWLKGFKRSLETAKKGGGLPGDIAKRQKEQEKDAKPQQAELTKYLPGSKWTRVMMEISLMKEPTDSICAFGSSNPLDWNAMAIEGTAATQMKSFKDGEFYIHRTGANKWFGQTDKDGKMAKPAKLSIGNKPKAAWVPYFKTGETTKPYDYGFFFWTGGSQQNLFGLNLNLAPQWGQRKFALLFYRSAVVLHANIEGTKLELYDDNFNGIVGEDPAKLIVGDPRFGTGLGEKTAMGHPAFDSMRIGKSKYLQPFSRYIHIGDYWYKLNVLGNNENLNYRPMDPANIPTGLVKMDFKGPSKAKPDYLVIQGQGFLKGAYFDIAHAPAKGIEVPAGQYVIYYGRILNGEGARAMNATMLMGDSKPIDVRAGELNKIKVGAPYTIEFESSQVGDDIIVDSSKFWVKGSAGERYGCIGSEVLEPELIWSTKNTGSKGKVLGSWRRMKSIEDFSTIRTKYKAYDLHIPYFCVADNADKTVDIKLTVKKPVKSGAFFVAVRQRKHKLFKKLEHVWK